MMDKMIDSYIDDILREKILRLNSIDYFSEKELSWTIVENGLVLPYAGSTGSRTKGGVVENNGCFVDQSGLHENHGCGYDFPEKDIVQVNKDAIYLGMFFPIWGHCITDNIKKLWFLRTTRAQELIQNGADLVYVVMMDNQYNLPQNFIDLLQAYGVDTIQIKRIKEPTKYSNIYIPDNSLYRVGEKIFYTKEFNETKNIILNNIPRSSIRIYDKIYFSRTRLKNGKQDFGEKRIEDVFRYLGYKIFYPEQLTLAEQITLLQNCSHFAATEGSTSHNSIFCKPKTKVIIIRKGAYLNNYQPTINAINNFEVVYIDAHLSIFTDKNRVWNGPFFLYANNNLLRFADIPFVFNNFSMHSFKKYAKLAYPKNKECMELTDFYSQRLIEEINMCYFSKGLIKRIMHLFLSNCNLSIWLPVYKKLFQK